ncbi:hypothetical protein [Streptomyces rhizosphaerihabitans]|uniref:hypothetical protein n=1 Tax=Streptomyces rhizosphaerihabitans TaxID=1266770 RepID=UPI0021C0FB3A|nr:hypothetical protein [Streptomyces rhizosphaerihabitans]MCT9008344.1 hypothetical protein [Streptomyces rhizosphaerihabitans]
MNLYVQGLREYGRMVTQEVEILDSVDLPVGVSYQFVPVGNVAAELQSDDASKEFAGTPREFEDRRFMAGDRILIDFDPGYQLFFYPAGRYPRARLWPVALVATLIGTAAALGVANLL